MEIPNQFSYVSAPTSPRRFNTENMNFYSVPTSPTRGLSSAQLGFAIEPTTPTYEDAKSSFDDFEFDTSGRFSLISNNTETYQNFENPLEHQLQQQKQERQSEDSLSLPTMAFADELFSDGKVLPQSPLKLPPRLQYVNNKSGNQSPAGSPPRSPGSVLKLSFSRRSMWNDDFDPFMVALENVREEKRGKTQGHNHRRTRSLSPLRAARPQESNYLTGSIHHQDKKLGLQIPMEHESNGSAFATLNNPREPIEQVGPSPKKLAEPKGLSFARQVRLVKMDHEMPTKPNMTTPSGPTVEAEESGKEIGGSFTRENKRQNIKKFLFRSASVREQNVAQCKEDKKVAKVAKMTVIQYRPRLLLCMGFGAKYVE
ncbi:hypothetical protein ACB092_08G124400 [Castanea dentata]